MLSCFRHNKGRLGRSFLELLVINGTVWAVILTVYVILQCISHSFLLRSSQHVPPFQVPDEYAIYTSGCRLLETPVWPDYFKDNWDWRNNPVPDCRNLSKHVTLSADQKFLQLNENTPEGLCTLWQIRADPHDDNGFIQVSLGEITERIVNVQDLEMMKIDCNGSYNFEARVIFKDSAAKKMKFWSRNTGKKPYNVLFIAYDSTSRKHAFRGFNGTMKIMESMGFLDFRGHHAFVPKTLPNFLAFTSGLNEHESQNTCHPHWEDPHDDCPFIWKNYAAHNVVTALIEDSPGQLNYGGQTGFKIHPPTDYYTHPLMQALGDIEYMRPWTAMPCVSTETTFAFLKRYIRRFMEQFEGTPYFVLNYNNELFHDFPFAVPSHDEAQAEFFEFLENSADVRENTLIILAGDHGDRFNFFSHDSLDAYLERSLAALFVRFPDRLKREFPGLVENTMKNTRRLTTAYDIHHTMLHLLALNGFQVTPNISAADFQPCLHDRCSLLAAIPETRTCDQVKVYKGFCVCNTTRSSNSLDNKFFIDKLTDFALRELNDEVDSTKYGPICEYWRWLHTADTLISVTTLEELEDTRRYLLRFYAAPEMWATAGEEFSVRLRVLGVKGEEFAAIEREGDFSRISRYGNQSWCIPSGEQQLKPLCYCKPEPRIQEIWAEEESNKEAGVETDEDNNEAQDGVLETLVPPGVTAKDYDEQNETSA